MRTIKALLLSPIWGLGFISGYLIRPMFEGAVYGFYSREFSDFKRKQKIIDEYSSETYAKEKQFIEEELNKMDFSNMELNESELYKHMCDVVEEFDKQIKENTKEEGWQVPIDSYNLVR